MTGHTLSRHRTLLRTVTIIATLILLAVLLNRFGVSLDMTANNRHTLLPATKSTLALFDKNSNPVSVEVFISPRDNQTGAIRDLLDRYQQHTDSFSYRFTDPALDPGRTRELDIAAGGEIIVSHAGRTQRLSGISEQALTTALQRLKRSTGKTAIFLTGHQERAIKADNGGDLSHFASQLKQSGIEVETTNLAAVPYLDHSRGPVIIASPLNRYLPGETASLLDFISRGGDLLWLTEPHSDDGLKALAIELGFRTTPGVVVDLASQQLRVERPDFALAHQYGKSPATLGFESVSIFPQATALEPLAGSDWLATSLVQTGDQSWTETGSLKGEVRFGDNSAEIAGPLTIAMSLQRDRNGTQQKVIIVGDGDFLADAWIANGGNRDLANRLLNWLVDDEHMLQIDQQPAVDTVLNISNTSIALLTATALVILPGLMFGTATGVWYRRRNG